MEKALKFPSDFTDKGLDFRTLLNKLNQKGVFITEFDSQLPQKDGKSTSAKYKVERSVSIYPGLVILDPSEALELTEEQTRKVLDLQTKRVNEAYKDLQARADELQKQVLIMLVWEQLLCRRLLLPAKHPNNHWVNYNELSPELGKERSNAVYKMFYRVETRDRWDPQSGNTVPVAWYVTWRVTVQHPANPNAVAAEVAGQERKLFKTEQSAMDYLEGRIKAYDKLFTEEFPPVPTEYADAFRHMGVLMPGYRLKEEA